MGSSHHIISSDSILYYNGLKAQSIVVLLGIGILIYCRSLMMKEMTGELVCARCRKESAMVITRKEKFCNKCFQKFVSAKQRKQMMSDAYFQDVFKVMYQDKVRTAEEANLQNCQSNILVPLSFGSSSLVMLDILNDTLTEQKESQRGKTGFQIDVLICFRDTEEKLKLKQLINELSIMRFASNKEKLNFHFIHIDSFYDGSDEELQTIILDHEDYASMAINGSIEPSKNYSVTKLLAQCVDRSSREDLLSFIKRHLIKKFAYKNGHKVILWGNSMTKLADETISLVVKGRGSQIAAHLDSSQFDSDYRNRFKNLYPMRDVLLSEIDAYCYVTGLNKYLHGYHAQETLLTEKNHNDKDGNNSRLIKNMTINELARKYFDDIECDYSNVISTVVRTADKLMEPKSSSTSSVGCSICLANITTDGSSWLRAITVNNGHPVETEEESDLLEKWKNTEVGNEFSEYLRLKEYIFDNGDNVPLCYGCIINLNRMKKKCVTWPMQNNTEVESVLNEFTITD